MNLADKIIIADDHPLFREALRQAVERVCPGCEIVEAEDLTSLQAVTDAHPNADLLLLDLHMPGVNGFSGLIYVRSHQATLPTVVVSALEETWVIQRARGHGAAGFIPKSAPVRVIAEAMQTVLEGERWFPPGTEGGSLDPLESDIAERIAQLTPQQFRVLMLLSEGLLNKQIAFEMSVSEATVKAHVTAIMKKLKVNNRTQAVLEAARLTVKPPKLDPATLEQA